LGRWVVPEFEFEIPAFIFHSFTTVWYSEIHVNYPIIYLFLEHIFHPSRSTLLWAVGCLCIKYSVSVQQFQHLQLNCKFSIALIPFKEFFSTVKMSYSSSSFLLLVLISSATTSTSFRPSSTRSLGLSRLNAVTFNPKADYVETVVGQLTENLISEEMVTDDASASALADRCMAEVGVTVRGRVKI
jgi:hypothetical protein